MYTYYTDVLKRITPWSDTRCIRTSSLLFVVQPNWFVLTYVPETKQMKHAFSKLLEEMTSRNVQKRTKPINGIFQRLRNIWKETSNVMQKVIHHSRKCVH